MRRHLGVALIVGAVIALACFCIGLLFPDFRDHRPSSTPLHFDEILWRADDGKRFGERSRMVDDLVDRKLLVGLHRDDVYRLLGMPDNDAKFDDFDDCWLAGFELGWQIDHCVLAVRYVNDRVAVAERLHVG